MARIKITSDPYNRVMDFDVFNKSIGNWEDISVNNPNSKLRDDTTGRAFFPFKVKEIVDIIVDEYYANNEKVELEFEGTQDDFYELATVCSCDDIVEKINLSKAQRILENARIIIQPTKEIFDGVQPIIEKIVKDDANIISKLNKVSDALNDIIPICVFGNYSAGKSTFINALIGSEVLPSGGDPVTAKVYKISRSDYNDIARIKFSYLEEKFLLLFEGANLRVMEGDIENDLIKDIIASIDEITDADMFKMISVALELINGYEKKDRDVVVISNVIELEVPFAKTGLLGRSYNNFVIFDTPGSNSSSNIEHSMVLEEALEGFSNGIPVWVSTYESVDSTDNASLCDKILNIDALDKRFTMIILNKADGSDLDEDGFSKKHEQEILEYGSVEKMYAGGIYFVSSIMGIGAKNDGNLVDKHYRRIYRAQQDMYSDPEDEDYATLYRYNIMPEQIKQNVIDYCEAMEDDLMYVNSGLYCVEREMETFASKYAAYNKCQMVYSFLKDIISETDLRITTRTDALKRTREARSRELESTKAILIDELNKTSMTCEYEYDKNSKAFVKDYTNSQFDFSIKVDDLEEKTNALHGENVEEKDLESQQKGYENSKERLKLRLMYNAKNLFTKGFVENIKTLADDFSRDYKEVKDEQAQFKAVDRDVDKETADELLQIVVDDYKRNVMIAKEMLSVAIRDVWQNDAQTLKNTLVSIITGSDALTSVQREELSAIIMDFKKLEFNDDAEKVFMKSKFLRGNVLGIKISDSERLNIRKLTSSYNSRIKSTIFEMATLMNNNCYSIFRAWKESLSAVIEDNITDYNPQLRDMSDMIKEETERINELEDNQNMIRTSLEGIKDLMSWKEMQLMENESQE